ncbi:Acg family FMN-binding oxidoreductase [Ktedonospora formicarum]|uniref:Nitroreductase n=1 Tax=Ktedonospora formicarum TaxID=2778364 RepID=A0A8J3I3P1_9CHLR|nr:hypothetical protein [Ktedonospora formicarum]GHO48734.1 hypothetical protein KSX_68970 [Ktedonospora formicarum]
MKTAKRNLTASHTGMLFREATISEQLNFLLRYAVLAPSEYNSQPWLFQVYNQTIDVYADYSRRLPTVDPEGREVLISCGAVCVNLRLALHHFGHQEMIDFFPDPAVMNLIARITIAARRERAEEDQRLFHAISQRHTNREAFSPQAVPSSLLEILKKEAGHEGAWLYVVSEEDERQYLIDLIVEGSRKQWANMAFRSELAHWVRAKPAPDGIPAFAHPRGSSHPFLARTIDFGWFEERRIQQQLQPPSTALAILGTFGDSSSDWLLAGHALERVLLTAAADGVQASFFNQPIEVPEMCPRLSALLDRFSFPQMILRLGYGPSVMSVPRRSSEEMVVPKHG